MKKKAGDLVKQVCFIFISVYSLPDSLVWRLSVDGEYLVKSDALLAKFLFNSNVVKIDYYGFGSYTCLQKSKFLFE